jgi:hypothetical protein
MPLIKRNYQSAESQGVPLSTAPASRGNSSKRTPAGRRSTVYTLLWKALVAIGIVCVVGYIISSLSVPLTVPAIVRSSSLKRSNAKTFNIDNNVELVLDLTEDNTSLGPYRAILLAKKSTCPNLGFWLRLEGDALDTVQMKEQGDRWEGTFSFPVVGHFEVVAYWKGCDSQSTIKKFLLFTVNVEGEPSQQLTSNTESSLLYPKAAWISSKRFNEVTKATQYVWHNPFVAPSDATLITTTNSTTSKQGATFTETGFYSFHQLSNYELVCWVGSQSAKDSRNVFLEERRFIASEQRPFKFHIYASNNLVHPAEDWPELEQARFRKCKHILVSMDQIKTPLTQQEYADQVTGFINHLTRAFPDETFPIWMFTVNESPMAPTNCLPPCYLPRTSDHPCNDVLKDLFDRSKTTFPDRVNLLDNTAISFPQLGENPYDVQAAIALRIFVLVGKRVREWRKSGQVGRENGLHRNGAVEPNFELVPYPDWQ